MRSRTHSQAFVLAELLALVAILGIVAAVLLVGASDTRRRSMLAGSIDNLRQMGAAVLAFGADNDDRIASFSWRPGVIYQADDGYEFPPAPNYTIAACNQAVAIIRRRTQRTDIAQINGWFPYAFHNYLVLADYQQGALPSRIVVSPGDVNRLAWQRHVFDGFFALHNRPSPGQSNNDLKRWPYSSSYEFAPASISPDAAAGGLPTIAQGPTHRIWNIPPNDQVVLGNRHLSEVRFPSQKVLVFETLQRFFGARELFFAYDEARVPCLFADGAVSVAPGSEVNPGFQPNAPTSPLPTRIRYEPELSWEPPTISGNVADFVNGHQRWCRSGLRGRDTGGPEVPWQ